MISVTKKINLGQLNFELNNQGLIAENNQATKEIIAVGLADSNTATLKELQTAIEKHIAQPDAKLSIEDRLTSVGLNVEDLKTALGL